MKIAVVTPTIGSDLLAECLHSVQKQTYKDIVHYVFIDGEEHEQAAYEVLSCFPYTNIKTIKLQENIGKGWYGHRVYAACSFLVEADAICYLDEDNWFEEDHIENLVKKLQEGNDWAYSLRKICNKDGDVLFEDNCESLGDWPVWVDSTQYLIDTSSFCVRKDVAVKIGHSWYGQWGADRQFFGALRQYFKNYACTGKYSLCYRLDGNPNSVSKEFFETGNKQMDDKYKGKYPWREDRKFVQVAPGVTIKF